jgi:hypothetical protein
LGAQSSLTSDHGSVSLSKVSIRVSAAYVIVVAGLAAIAMLTSWG